MGGHIVLVVQNSQMHDELIRGLAGDGCCALCFRSIEEGVAYLREPGCPASVVVFNVEMRRQSDYAAVIELGAARPELQVLLIAQEQNALLDSLSGGQPRGVDSRQAVESPGVRRGVAPGAEGGIDDQRSRV